QVVEMGVPIEKGTEAKDPSKEAVFTLPPAQLVEGRVTYEDTKKPIAGARVSMMKGAFSVQTDKDGRYRLNPLMRATPSSYWDETLIVLPPAGEPYVGVTQGLDKAKAGVKRTANIALPRGVVVNGKLTEAGSGKPVAGAVVYYLPRYGPVPQPSRRGLAVGEIYSKERDGAGQVRIIVPPRQGHLVVEGPNSDYVRHVMGTHILYNC